MKTKLPLKVVFLGVLVCLVITIALPGMAASKKPVKIGALLPLSPPGSYASGQEMKWSMEIARDNIGTVLGRPLRLITYNTRGLPEETEAATRRLIEKEKVVGIVGNFHSSCALAAMPVVHKFHVPYIGAEPWTDKLTASGYPEIFRISVSNTLYSGVIADWVEAAGFKTVAAVVESTDWGLGAFDRFEEQVEGVDIKQFTADLETQDFTSTLLRIKRMQPPPDILLGWMTGPAQYRLLNQAKDLGIAPTSQTAYKGESPVLFPEFWENVGSSGKYVVMHEISLPKSGYNDKTRAYIEEFRTRHDRAPTSLGMEGYDSFSLMVQAIKEAGSTDSDAIIETLEGIEWQGVQGTYTFEYGSDNPVPEDKPDWVWHQWMDVPMILRQYTKVDQDKEDAPVIWPPKLSTVEKLYFSPPKE